MTTNEEKLEKEIGETLNRLQEAHEARDLLRAFVVSVASGTYTAEEQCRQDAEAVLRMTAED